MTYNDLCDNGCPYARYPKRKICKNCVAAEMRARRANMHEGHSWGRGRPKLSLSPQEIQAIAKENASGKSLRQLAAQHKVSPKTMTQYLKNAGYEVRTWEKTDAMETEKEFFKGYNPIMGRMARVSLGGECVMGQAKLRGSFEQRQREAIERNAAAELEQMRRRAERRANRSEADRKAEHAYNMFVAAIIGTSAGMYQLPRRGHLHDHRPHPQPLCVRRGYSRSSCCLPQKWRQGHSINMLPDELHEAAFRRYCDQEDLTFIGPIA